MTTVGSDNKFPKVFLEEVANDGSATDIPVADHRALFLGEDGLLHLKDSAAAVTDVGGGSSDLDAIITASSGQDIADALDGAAAPDAGNVFATMADVGGGGGDFTFINEVVVASAQAAMLITGIPDTYRELVISILARSTTASEVEGLNMQVGAGSLDTGTNYRYTRNSQGTGDVNASSTGASSASIGMSAAANNTAGNFDMTEVIVANYADTTYWRRMLTRSVHFGNDRYINHGGVAWVNTADAIARVSVSLTSGNFDVGSRMTIYGRG